MVSGLDAGAVRAWVDAFLDAADAQRVALGELDRESGDGDFGTNLLTSVTRARTDLANAPASADPGAPFAALSNAFLHTGGTSGPLYGVWFRELARALSEHEAASLDVLARAVATGTETVQRLGGAAVGDKTMVDAMVPAVEALQRAHAQGDPLAQALATAATAARVAAEATADLVARRGRASYVGEVARGVVDPGALTVALFFEAAPGVTSAAANA